MKIKNIFAVALTLGAIATTPIMFTACDDADEVKKVVDNTSTIKLVGNYSGETTLGAGKPANFGIVTGHKVSVASQDPTKGLLTVTLSEFTCENTLSPQAPYTSVAAKSFEVKNVSTTFDKEGNATLKANVEGKIVLKTTMKDPKRSKDFTEYDVLNGKLEGSIDANNKMMLTFTFQPQGMPMPLVLQVKAKK